MSNAPGTRGSLLERAAASVGETWAGAWLGALATEGRAAAGGWPGTLSEARSRVRVAIHAELTRARLDPASTSELADAARRAYACARTRWLASAHADDAPDPLSDDDRVTSEAP